jgi:hypothetical protein
MSAEIIILPVVRVDRVPDRNVIDLEVELERPLYSKLMSAAASAATTPEDMAEALILFGLAAMEKKTLPEFCRELGRPAIAVPFV